MRVERRRSGSVLARAPLHLAAAGLAFAVLGGSLPPARAGSLVVPAWAFDRGNALVDADPARCADAGPVLRSGPREPWGWLVRYEIEVPVVGEYLVRIRYAAAEARPIDVLVGRRNIGTCCRRVTPAPGSARAGTWKSSGARWEAVENPWGSPARVSLEKGTCTVTLARRGPLPHLVALRLDTPAAFPADWRPPRREARGPGSVPAARGRLLVRPGGFGGDVLHEQILDAMRTFGPRYPRGEAHLRELAQLEGRRAAAPAGSAERVRIEAALRALWREAVRPWCAPPAKPRAAGSLLIPAWTFDRGEAEVYASPDRYADAGPLVGSADPSFAPASVEYEIDLPVSADWSLQVRYAAAEARPLTALLDGRRLGCCCEGVTFGSAPFEQPAFLTWRSSGARWEPLRRWGEPLAVPVSRGRHTLRLERRGPLPHLVALRLDSSAPFPKGWKPRRRRVAHLERVAPVERAALLPPDAVSTAALRLAIEDTTAEYGPRYPHGPQWLAELSALERRRSAAAEGTEEEEREIEEALARLRRRALLSHPLLREIGALLFVTRVPHSAHIYEDHCASEPGGNLCVLSPVAPGGKVTVLAPELEGGRFSRYDLSFDARGVVFGYRRPDGPFRLHELALDPASGRPVAGSLRQLTFGSAREAEIVRRFGSKGRGIGSGFQDLEPIYLPAGRIAFISTRSMRNVFCFPATVTTLYAMEAGGGRPRRLSEGPLSEMSPSLLDDGRIVYTRWEYVDKGLGNGQSLWAMRPDGSGVEHVYKNSTARPAGMVHARGIPGSDRIVAIGNPHCGREGGPVILIDNRATRRSPEAMTCITPEIGYPCMFQANWDMGFFRDPYPLCEKLFLVSHAPGPRRRDPARYGIYVLDRWGNRAELHREAELSCFQPVPLRPRREPPRIAGAAPPAASAGKAGERATIFIQDIYRGMTGIERGRVAYVRVMGVLPWPWQEEGMFRIGLNVGVHRKKVLGVARVREDGSACFEVPARQNLLFQALDRDFALLQHMPTFINLAPGEHRSCIGCHESRREAPRPASGWPLAFEAPPEPLEPQPGDAGPRMVDYAADVQPILDEHCHRCHGGQRREGGLDLSGVPTESFNLAYENLIGRGLVSYRDCRYGRSGFRPEPPLSFGSHLSPLVDRIGREPCSAGLSRQERVRIYTWIDANVPYYGTYRGKRGLDDKDDPDFRALPLAAR